MTEDAPNFPKFNAGEPAAAIGSASLETRYYGSFIACSLLCIALQVRIIYIQKKIFVTCIIFSLCCRLFAGTSGMILTIMPYTIFFVDY